MKVSLFLNNNLKFFQIMKQCVIFIFAVLFVSGPYCFTQTAPVNGLRSNTPAVTAFTNVTIITSPGKKIDNGTMVIRDGVIEEIGPEVNPPADAWIIDMSGKTIYPGFIDMWSETGLDDPGESLQRQIQAMNIPPEYTGLASQFINTAGSSGAMHYNSQVQPWYDASTNYRRDDEDIKILRSNGFVLINTVPPAGIFRGATALVSLGNSDINNSVVRKHVSQAMSFDRSRGLGGEYPTSLMGSISLIRQTWYDAQWYRIAHSAYRSNPAGVKRPELNLALEALLDASEGRQPVIFDVKDEIALLRAVNIASEFNLNLWVKGSGYEYRRLDAIREAGIPLILPVVFPKIPEIESPEDAMNVTLEELRHWDFAPENPGMLNAAGVKIALTSSGLGKDVAFTGQLRLAVQRGLNEDAALAALTVTPAEMLGIEKHYGTLEKGKVASFIVTDGLLFESETKIEQVWVDGTQFDINKPSDNDVRGEWKISSSELGEMVIEINGTPSRLNGSVSLGDKKVKISSVKSDQHRMQIVFPGDSLGINGIVRLSAPLSANGLFGIGELADEGFINWKGIRVSGEQEEKPVTSVKKSQMSEGSILYPSMEYGIGPKPAIPSHVLVRNATIWTQGPQGKIDNADMLVSNGRVMMVGHNLTLPRGAMVIEANGRHVTPGIVDPHLHSSIGGGVNETGNNMTPETRVGDVIEPDNIWVYRLLAGGMTTANLLHGSANPIGGQDAVVKMRWGALPDEFLLQGAKPGLKLALGENVVRNASEYPNTRMGAEQIIKDAFQSAKDYISKWERWEKSKTGIPPRKDLQMEALAEVLRGERIVHAHAYRQDEMQMLIRLAEETGFKIASFEHTVEGYKIADILRDHGAAAIVWTDWSSFKVEAADGILYNARLLHDNGVLTSLHSDDTQLSTRMNWEAGKLLATGIDEISAMDMITINPARILGADNLVGSLEPGKHADFVIWSGHPLSGFTHAQQTWIEGRKYFDRLEDMEKRVQVIQERTFLIQKALKASDKSGHGSGQNIPASVSYNE
jgi:imidazolonepropionase-like amidohydrolase